MTGDHAQRIREIDALYQHCDALARAVAEPSNLPRPEGPPPAKPDTPRTTMPAQALRHDRMTVGLLR